MKTTHYDLGYRHRGEVVEVTLRGNAANVQLMDTANLNHYRRTGRARRSYGGHYQYSPVRLAIPHDGHWHVAIDLGGYAGSVRSAVRVLSLRPTY